LFKRTGPLLVDHLRGPIWEIRTTLDNRIARTLFAVEQTNMVLLHGFIKKTRKTVDADIDLALKRLKEWRNGEKKSA
jgi:phage-related protein